MKLACPLCNKSILEDEKYYSFFNCRDCDQTFDMPDDEYKKNMEDLENGNWLLNERPIKAKNVCHN